MATATEPPEPVLPRIRKILENTRPQWRLLGWGSAAAIALTALAIAVQTESGSQRLQHAFAPQSPPTRGVAVTDVPTRVIGIDTETLRLEAQLRVLTADRDRLAARIALLEHNLDDVTGSIKRQEQEAAKVPAPSTPAVTRQAAAPANPPTTATSPAKTEAPPVKTELPIIAPLAMPAAATESSAPWPGTSSAQTAPQDAASLPQNQIAALPITAPATEPPRKPAIGIDLGGAPNMEVLNMRWVAVKANFGPLLTGLHPLVAHVHRQGTSGLRLLVGPLPSIAAAAQLCTRFASARVTCRPAKFEGEQIAQR